MFIPEYPKDHYWFYTHTTYIRVYSIILSFTPISPTRTLDVTFPDSLPLWPGGKV
jgi:hypothetical protein